MRIHALALGFLCTAGLWGQGMNWQNYCFDHPKAAPCPNREFSGKRNAGQSDPAPSSNGVTKQMWAPIPKTPGGRYTGGGQESTESGLLAFGDVNWQFAEPASDALAGFHVSRLAASPLARSVIVALGAERGLSGAAMQKILDQIANVDEAGVSVKDNRIVAAVTGPVNESLVVSGDLKAMPISKRLGLIGQPDAVDQATQRIAFNGPSTDWTRMAEKWQSGSDFWVVGSGEILGLEAAATGLRQFSVTVWAGEQLSVDMVFDFSAPLSAEALAKWQAALGPVEPEGNTIHFRTSVGADELNAKLARFTESPLGQPLASLVQAAQVLPVRESAKPRPTKPVIYGLDNGPRTVGETSH